MTITNDTILPGRTRSQTKADRESDTEEEEKVDSDDEYGEIAMVCRLMGISEPMYSLEEPKAVEQALLGPDKDKWWKAMCEEFESLERRKVGELWKKKHIPANRRLVGKNGCLKGKMTEGFVLGQLQKDLVKCLALTLLKTLLLLLTMLPFA